MIIVEYDPELGHPVRDGDAIRQAEMVKASVQRSYPEKFVFSTENVFYQIRLLVLEEKIDYKSILFRYKEKNLTLNEYGVLDEWVEGFLDQTAKMCQRLILGGTKKRIAKRKKETDNG